MLLLILSQPTTSFSVGISAAVGGFPGFSHLHCLSSMNSSRLTLNLCKGKGKGVAIAIRWIKSGRCKMVRKVRPEFGICRGQRWCSELTSAHGARLSVCPWRSQCFLHTERRPEAGTELLRLEEAHPKWQFYLGSLGMAGPAARAGFTWLVSGNLICSGLLGHQN